jgi:hypothetical protein
MIKNYVDVKNTFNKLHQRMDDTMKTYRLESYVVLANKAGKDMPNTSKIILNKPRVFGDAIMASLAKDKMSFDITGIDATIQSMIEKLLPVWLYLNDESLFEQEIESLGACFDFQTCFRGWIGVLPLIFHDLEKKLYLPSAAPIDPRWAYWARGARGLSDSVNFMRLDRTYIEKMVTEGKYLRLPKSDKAVIDVACCWDGNDYRIAEMPTGSNTSGEPNFDNPIYKYEHNFGFCPTLFIPVPIMPYQISSGNDASTDLQYQGEDVYAPVRDTIKYMNEFASIWATLNRQQFDLPIALRTDRDMTDVTLSGYGVKVQLNKGEEFVNIPTRDMSTTAIGLLREMFADFERGTFSSVNYGEAGDRQSALAIADLKSDTDKVKNPRRDCKAIAYRRITNMWRRMINAGKYYETTIDEENGIPEAEFNKIVADGVFAKKFVVNVKFDSVSPQERIVAAQQAAQLNRECNIPWVEAWRMTNLVDDPEGMYRKAAIEIAGKMSPEVAIYQAALALTNDDKALQSQIDETMQEILIMRLGEFAQNQSSTPPIVEPSNPASQPKQEITTSGGNSNKKARRLQENNGQATINQGRQPR